MKLERSELELAVLVRRLEDEEIDLQPDFQRGEVWSLANRRRLIDTILRGWYVPAIHLVSSGPDSEIAGTEVVLDGQQRLATIRDFYDDQFTVDGGLHPKDPAIQRLHGLKFSQLPSEVVRRMARFTVAVVTVTEQSNPEEPYELFFRLNQQVSLTPSEKRNALYGPARDQVRNLVSTLVDSELLSKESVGFENGRLGYDDVLARFCLILEQRTLRNLLTNSRIEQFYREGDFSPGTVESAGEAAAHFLTSARQSRTRYNKASLLSWFLFSHQLLRRGNGSLGTDLLERFEELRTNAVAGDWEGEPTREPSEAALNDVLLAYSDRSSYRVGDVTSVLVRDLALHLFYDHVTHEERPEFADIWADLLRGGRSDLPDLVTKYAWSELTRL